jgi:hypothetical protein
MTTPIRNLKRPRMARKGKPEVLFGGSVECMSLGGAAKGKEEARVRP